MVVAGAAPVPVWDLFPAEGVGARVVSLMLDVAELMETRCRRPLDVAIPGGHSALSWKWNGIA